MSWLLISISNILYVFLQVNQLIDEETRRYRGSKKYLEHLPPVEYDKFLVRTLKITVGKAHFVLLWCTIVCSFPCVFGPENQHCRGCFLFKKVCSWPLIFLKKNCSWFLSLDTYSEEWVWKNKQTSANGIIEHEKVYLFGCKLFATQICNMLAWT